MSRLAREVVETSQTQVDTTPGATGQWPWWCQPAGHTLPTQAVPGPSSCSALVSSVAYCPLCSVCCQAEQQKKAAVISAEGDSKAAELIANSLATAGDGLIELRKLEAAEDIAYQLSRSRNITYLPSGQSVLLQLPQ